jgi:retron-type reverse transcriptase
VGRSGPKDKSFDISKQLVWEAYRRVKVNKGAPGVDEQSLAEFESDLKNNLYKIWSASRRTGGEAMSLDS